MILQLPLRHHRERGEGGKTPKLQYPQLNRQAAKSFGEVAMPKALAASATLNQKSSGSENYRSLKIVLVR